MTYRVLPLVLVALALAVFATAPALAADKDKADKGDTHEGRVVKAADGKLTMSDKDGKNEHTHVVGAVAVITCDGKKCKLEDIKVGFSVRVTTEKKDDKAAVTKIEAKSKD